MTCSPNFQAVSMNISRATPFIDLHACTEKAMKFLICIAVLVAAADLAAAEVGDCRYDPNACSCKMGSAFQGVCWDAVNGKPGFCIPRACKAGWTCACSGRTHVCSVESMTSWHNNGADRVTISDVQSAGVPLVIRQTATLARPCARAAAPTASHSTLTLGTIKFGISPNGVLNKGCHELAWWHNGRQYGNYSVNAKMTASTFSSTMNKMENHSLLELRPGDVVAFRFKRGSCTSSAMFALFVQLCLVMY
jgi:hypothetical protein